MTDRNKEQFEQWYLSLPHTSKSGLVLMPKSESGLEILYRDGVTQCMFDAWKARADKDANAELVSCYVHSLDAAKAEIQKLKQSNESAWQQTQNAQKARNAYGLQISAALRGQKRSDEPEGDLRLEAIRGLVEQSRQMQKALSESLDELESYIKQEYPEFKLRYPNNLAKFQHEMDELNERRQILESPPVPSNSPENN